jgi:glutamine synthetase
VLDMAVSGTANRQGATMTTTTNPPSGARRPGMPPDAGLPTRQLERMLGRPAHEWTTDDLIGLVRAHEVRVLSLMHVGGDGWVKTLDFVPHGDRHLRDVIDGGERADGSSLFAGTGIDPAASDVLLRPRVSSAFLDPFSEVPTLVLMCSHASRDGSPLPGSPDTILRAADSRVRRCLGIDLYAHGEVEYFLGRRTREEDFCGADDRGYHASSPFVFGELMRRRAMTVLAEIGVPVKYGHSEVGYVPATDTDDTIWEQHEIELALSPLTEAAEAVALTQWVLRNLAHDSGLRVTFDPVVRRGHAGSGLHFHFCPMRAGHDAEMRGPAGGLSVAARCLIAGLVRHGGGLMAFGNRVEGSFIRLAQGKETPGAIAWGEFDRRALVRLPALAAAANGRPVGIPSIEFRLPDGSAQPFLLLAAVAQAMVAEREAADLEALLDRTAAAHVREHPGDAPLLPRTRGEIASGLIAARAALEAGGVFPPGLLDMQIAALRG